MAKEQGVVGSTVGPTPGQTASDADSLASNPGPFGPLGTPPENLTGDPNRPFSQGSPLGYYSNPAVVPGNPYAATGAPTKGEAGDQRASAYAAATLDNLYAHTVGNYASSGADDDADDVNEDEGFAASGQGRS